MIHCCTLNREGQQLSECQGQAQPGGVYFTIAGVHSFYREKGNELFCSVHKELQGAVKLRWQTSRGEYEENIEILHWPQN